MSGAALPVRSLAEVVAAGRELATPFRLRLWPADPDDGAAQDIDCLAVMRLLPGRRLVARVRVDGRSALLKLFLGASARRYCARERRGCALLTQAGVATPALRGAVREPADSPVRARGLLFEYLPDAVPLRAEDAAGVQAAAAELARLHGHGCRHGDLHLDNFLRVSDTPRPALVDGDGVRRVRRAGLSRRRSIDELAVLCAQRPPLADADLAAVYGTYAAVRGWPAAVADGAAGPAALAAAVRRQRRARLRRYLRKAQRDCTEFLCRRSWRRYTVAQRSAWDTGLAELAADPEAAFAGATVLKAGNSATVVRARLGTGTCVIKRYNLKSPWQALRRKLRPTARFRRAWLNGQRLHMLGIPTARPLALVEGRWGPLRGVAYLVMPDLGSGDLAADIERGGLSARRQAQVVDLFRALHAAGLTHGDTKASNFLVDSDRVHLVDLDAMVEGGDGPRRDIARFLANFDHLPEVRRRFAEALAAAGVPVADRDHGGDTGGFAV